MKKVLVSAMLTLTLAAGVTGTVISASAANEFSASSEGNAVYPSGASEATVMAALNEKVSDLNADIQAVLSSGGDLAQAYAEGEIIAYSIASGSDGTITETNRRSGWKVWEGAALMDLKYINAGYGGWGDNYVAWLSYNGVKDEAYLITAEFADQYQKDGNQKLGSAAGDMFRVSTGSAYVTYQNFTNGYIKSESGKTTVVNKKNVVLNQDGTAVTEVDADPTSTGFIGAATSATLQKAGVSGEAFANAFVSAYNRYKEAGYNVGYPFSPVMDNGQNSSGSARYGTLCSQNFRWGDSVSDVWNDGNRSQWAFLAYNFEQGRVYLIADEFHYTFEQAAVADVINLGDPVSDAFLAADGNRYQNFESGYMKAEGADPQNKAATVVLNQNVDADGVASDIDMASKIGVLGKTVTDSVIPEKYTAETFSAAFKAAYGEKVDYADGEELASVALVAYENGVFSQKYTDNNGKKHMLAYVAESDSFVYLRPEAVSKYESNLSLGAPSGERMLVAEKDTQSIYAYPFTNGYIRLTVSEQAKIEGGQVVYVLNESGVATVGAVFDEEKNFFETVSYADSINESIVNASVANAYDFLNIPDAATLVEAFKTEYEKAFEMGFSAGKPASEGITWWTTGQSGIVKLTLAGGNGNANFWGDNTLMTYNPVDGNVYITTGEIANCYAAQGASGNGWALGEMKINTATGDIVQQFDLHDPVVETRPVYIIVSGGTASKVSGTYDFEANKNGGEWVDYISQFGGSISAKVVSVDPSYKTGEEISVDFSAFVENENGYFVTYTLLSEQGALSDAGVYTYTPTAAGKVTVQVEATSAFDKLAFTVELNVTDDQQGGDDSSTSDSTVDSSVNDSNVGGSSGTTSGGCGSSIIGLGVTGLAVSAGALAAVMIRKKRED